MNLNKGMLFITLLVIFLVYRYIFFSIVSSKSREIYKYMFAHRGFHLYYPENTLGAYREAVKLNLAVELDIRMLKDGNIVCFHDRYTNRLLKIPGKLSFFSYPTLKKKAILQSQEYIPTLKEALAVFDGKVPILIEVKGNFPKEFRNKLLQELYYYHGIVYFHTKNIITYYKLKALFHRRVFWICNIFRKRFNFLKGHHYKKEMTKCKDFLNRQSDISELYLDTNEFEIPTIDDVSAILVDVLEGSESVQELCASIASVFNRYETRVNKNHWLLKSLLLHRSIISNKYREHSKEGFEAAVEYAEANNIRVGLEFDLVWYKGQVRCHHDDRVSDKLGQNKSCAEKMGIEESLTLQEIIEIVRGHEKLVSIILDIKDLHFNRRLEEAIYQIILDSHYTGNIAVQSFNPLAVMWFEKNAPEYVRGQIGHSLSGLRRIPFHKFLWNVVNFILFNKSHADYCVYDNSNYIYIFYKYNRDMKGRPVLLYDIQAETEIKTSFMSVDRFANLIIENAADESAWSKEYVEKFALNDEEKNISFI